MQDCLANFDPQYWQFWIGLLLVLMVLFGRIYGAVIAAVVFAIGTGCGCRSSNARSSCS